MARPLIQSHTFCIHK